MCVEALRQLRLRYRPCWRCTVIYAFHPSHAPSMGGHTNPLWVPQGDRWVSSAGTQESQTSVTTAQVQMTSAATRQRLGSRSDSWPKERTVRAGAGGGAKTAEMEFECDRCAADSVATCPPSLPSSVRAGHCPAGKLLKEGWNPICRRSGVSCTVSRPQAREVRQGEICPPFGCSGA